MDQVDLISYYLQRFIVVAIVAYPIAIGLNYLLYSGLERILIITGVLALVSLTLGSFSFGLAGDTRAHDIDGQARGAFVNKPINTHTPMVNNQEGVTELDTGPSGYLFYGGIFLFIFNVVISIVV